ncbi:hypothetical protein BOTCAL_0210g00160 [Botryotinia calthae]|uniref:Uncharacterized protein n=1 Tax=Botryotinia calthae TaxID=38488 RepID=A0A4Y8CZE2_9HELO|nr:hypothetical protein BOTCAL_0210g00160 [Botryotinia calthae]
MLSRPGTLQFSIGQVLSSIVEPWKFIPRMLKKKSEKSFESQSTAGQDMEIDSVYAADTTENVDGGIIPESPTSA